MYEARLAEREKKGFFLFADGTKSTDAENKSRVAKEKKEEKPKDGIKNKSRLHKEEDGDEEKEVKEEIV